jgi:hypothetical protein
METIGWAGQAYFPANWRNGEIPGFAVLVVLEAENPETM